MYYQLFLSDVHARLRPQSYLEIGIRDGSSLALSRCPSVGIDPAFAITAELNAQVALYRTSSDEYFSRPDPLQGTGGRPFELSFIDGLHLFEVALRDFINAERLSTAKSVIIFDDVMPRTIGEATRLFRGGFWTGDIYPMIEVLAKYRPELVVLPMATDPTGLLVVAGLDPDSTVLADNYEQILAEFRHPDPQPVPTDVLERFGTVTPERLLQSELLDVLAEAAPTTTPQELRPTLARVVTESLGKAFAPAIATS